MLAQKFSLEVDGHDPLDGFFDSHGSPTGRSPSGRRQAHAPEISSLVIVSVAEVRARRSRQLRASAASRARLRLRLLDRCTVTELHPPSTDIASLWQAKRRAFCADSTSVKGDDYQHRTPNESLWV
jgi:hypothetical protein